VSFSDVRENTQRYVVDLRAEKKIKMEIASSHGHHPFCLVCATGWCSLHLSPQYMRAVLGSALPFNVGLLMPQPHDRQDLPSDWPHFACLSGCPAGELGLIHLHIPGQRAETP
jgi:hypothetical protein